MTSIYPTNLAWKKHQIWIEAENEDAAREIEYASSICSPLLSSQETDKKPIEVKSNG